MGVLFQHFFSSGTTMLKKVLYQQKGCEVIEIPVSGLEPDQAMVNACVDRIRAKLNYPRPILPTCCPSLTVN